MLEGLEVEEVDFYSGMYKALAHLKLSFVGDSVLDFDPERIFSICKLAGFNVVNSAAAFAEQAVVDDLPAVDSGVVVTDYLFSDKNSV
jgi:hypothetical protein